MQNIRMTINSCMVKYKSRFDKDTDKSNLGFSVFSGFSFLFVEIWTLRILNPRIPSPVPNPIPKPSPTNFPGQIPFQILAKCLQRHLISLVIPEQHCTIKNNHRYCNTKKSEVTSAAEVKLKSEGRLGNVTFLCVGSSTQWRALSPNTEESHSEQKKQFTHCTIKTNHKWNIASQ